MKRVFVALKFSENVVKEIKKIQEKIEKENLFAGKFTEPKNLHLTLKFLGEIDEEKIKEIRKKLGEIKFNSFEAELKQSGFFDNQKYGVCWIHLSDCEKLQKKIDEKLADLFKPEKRFMSHLTIARIKKIKDKKKFIWFLNKITPPKIKFDVNSFYLIESKLSDKGPTYSVIEEFFLKN